MATALGMLLVRASGVNAGCEVISAASAGPCAFLAGRKSPQGWTRLGHASLAEAVASAVSLNPHLVDPSTESLPESCMDVLCLHLASMGDESNDDSGCSDAPRMCREACQAAAEGDGPCRGMLVDDPVAGASPLECDSLSTEGLIVDTSTGGLAACSSAHIAQADKKASGRPGRKSPADLLRRVFSGWGPLSSRGLQEEEGPVYPVPEEPPVIGEVMGDPHVIGFDGGKYDLFGTGPVRLYESRGGRLAVHGKLKTVPEPAFSGAAGGLTLSFMHEVGIALGADGATTVAVDSEGGVRVNGDHVPGNTMRVLQGPDWAAVLQTHDRDVLVTKELSGGEFPLEHGGRTSRLRMQDGTEIEVDAIHGSHLDLRVKLPNAGQQAPASGVLGDGRR